jgi:uncharacterized protein (TIGR02246 family)
VSASRQKDAAVVAALFTEDAIQVLPDATIIKGRPDIEKSMKAQFDSPIPAVANTYSIDRVLIVSDAEAVAISHGDYTLMPKGKKSETRLNRFVDVWKKGADGVWRISYEINADGPAPSTDGGAPAKP